MSRCFPFPPPGYEKKARIDDTDLLIKEKHKEKKHKKDKKDKEKGDDKEKKEKHRSKEKHKDKKDRKEKHKDKEKDRNKERTSQTSNEKRIEQQSEISNTPQNDVVPDSKYVQELARRIMDEDAASGSQMVQKIAANGHRRNELTAVRRSADPQQTENERSQTVPKVAPMDHRRGELGGVAMDSHSGRQSSEREKLKEKNEGSKKFNGQRNHADPGGLEKSFVHNLSRPEERRVDRVGKMEEETERKEKSRHKESDGKGDKPLDGSQENKKLKEKDPYKERKQEEKAKETKVTNHEPPKLKGSAPKLKESSKDPLDFRITNQSDPAKLRNIIIASEGILGKRKEPEMNGVILDNGVWPHKVFKLPSSSPSVVENGRTSEPCIQLLHEKPGPSNNHKVDIKQHKNGLVPTQVLITSTKPLPANVPPPNEKGEPSIKLPHPDTKYLTQILSVPKMEELSDSLDQEWLFSSSSHRDAKKLNKGSAGTDGSKQVWANALQIESADIAALPYVLPY